MSVAAAVGHARNLAQKVSRPLYLFLAAFVHCVSSESQLWIAAGP